MPTRAQARTSGGRTVIFYSVYARNIVELSTPEDIENKKRYTMRFIENHFITSDPEMIKRACNDKHCMRTFFPVKRRVPIINVNGLLDETSVGKVIDQDVFLKANVRAAQSMELEKGLTPEGAKGAIDSELTVITKNRKALKEKYEPNASMRQGKPDSRATRSRAAMQKALEEKSRVGEEAGAPEGGASDERSAS